MFFEKRLLTMLPEYLSNKYTSLLKKDSENEMIEMETTPKCLESGLCESSFIQIPLSKSLQRQIVENEVEEAVVELSIKGMTCSR